MLNTSQVCQMDIPILGMGTMIQLVECLFCDHEVVGCPRKHTRDFKNGTYGSFAWHLALRKVSKDWSARFQYNFTWWNQYHVMHDISRRQNSEIWAFISLIHPDTIAI